MLVQFRLLPSKSHVHSVAKSNFWHWAFAFFKKYTKKTAVLVSGRLFFFWSKSSKSYFIIFIKVVIKKLDSARVIASSVAFALCENARKSFITSQKHSECGQFD